MIVFALVRVSSRDEFLTVTCSSAPCRYYVCPGTSSWNTLLGRTDNALLNIYNAGAAAKRHGAEGMLVTDWGGSDPDKNLIVDSQIGILGRFLRLTLVSWGR